MSPPPATAQKSVVHKAALVLVWMAVALSAVVYSEPAPFEILMMGLVVLLPVLGLARLTPALILLLSLWLVVGAGGFIASTAAFDIRRSALHAFITLYLSIASVVLAGFVRQSPAPHARLMMNAYLIAGSIASLAALVGYFDIVPSMTDTLTLFGRARGTFKDPNVLGAFLAPAIVFAMLAWLDRPGPMSIVPLAVAGLITLGALLSFSRGAWFNTAVSLALFGYLSLVTAHTTRRQLRLVLLAVFGVIGVAGIVVAALQLEAVQDLMAQRASLNQDYDTGPEGRFAGQEKAKGLVLEHPLGIGALEFGAHYHHEDVHNVYISMFLNAGWLGGAVYALIVAITMVFGVSAIFLRVPYQSQLIAAYAALTGQVLEGFIVDTDHWRHFFLLLGLVWGLGLAAHRDAGSGRHRQVDAPRMVLTHP
ncbi:MAG: O-antigen ligase family protein [Hyphomicrobiaceae bacterium]